MNENAPGQKIGKDSLSTMGRPVLPASMSRPDGPPIPMPPIPKAGSLTRSPKYDMLIATLLIFGGLIATALLAQLAR